MSTLEEIKIPVPLTQPSSLPLTTVFTPDSDCTRHSIYGTVQEDGNILGFYFDQQKKRSSCYPDTYEKYQANMKSDWYSPGVCPDRYVYAATAISTHTNAPATTFAICCLSDVPTAVYNLQPVVCYRSMTGDIADSFTFTAEYPGRGPTTDIYAPAIMIAWQHSDLSRFDPKSAPVYDLKRANISLIPDPFTETASEFASSTLPSDRSSTSYTNEFPTSTSKTKDQDESSEGGSHGLSTGATAGIGVGAAIAGMAVVGFLW